MKFSVVVVERGGQPRTVDFDAAEVTIGRVKGNDLVLPRGNVSKRHARLVVKGQAVVLVDLKSTNGTYVNGHRLGSPHVLKPGDKVYLGDFTLALAPPRAEGQTTTSRTPPPRTPPPRTPSPRTPPPRTPTPAPPPPRLPSRPPPTPPPLPRDAAQDDAGAEFFAPFEDEDASRLAAGTPAPAAATPRATTGEGSRTGRPPAGAAALRVAGGRGGLAEVEAAIARAVQRALDAAWADPGVEAGGVVRELVAGTGDRTDPSGFVLTVVIVLDGASGVHRAERAKD